MFPHLKEGLIQVPLPATLKDASWKEVLFYLVPTWHAKGTNLPELEWPVKHPFARSFLPSKDVKQDKSTNPDEVPDDTLSRDNKKLSNSDKAIIQTLIKKGEQEIPTWHVLGTNFLHKKVMYIISILIICAKPVSLNDLMQYMEYANRKTFRDNYLLPLRKAGFIELTIPENINDPDQRYKITEVGKAFLAGTIN